ATCGDTVVNGWQLAFCSCRSDRVPTTHGQDARGYDQTTVRSARESCDSPINLADVVDIESAHLYSERRRCSLYGAKLTDRRGNCRIPNDSHALEARSDFF